MDPIAELEKRIRESRKQLLEQEHALEVLKKAFGSGIPTDSDLHGNQGSTQSEDAFNFDDLKVEDKRRRSHIVSDVRQIVSSFGSNEFSMLHVDAARQKMGIDIQAKAPRARIALALTKLVEDGFLIRTYEGKGNVPHRYRLNTDTPNIQNIKSSNEQLENLEGVSDFL